MTISWRVLATALTFSPLGSSAKGRDPPASARRHTNKNHGVRGSTAGEASLRSTCVFDAKTPVSSPAGREEAGDGILRVGSWSAAKKIAMIETGPNFTRRHPVSSDPHLTRYYPTPRDTTPRAARRAAQDDDPPKRGGARLDPHVVAGGVPQDRLRDGRRGSGGGGAREPRNGACGGGACGSVSPSSFPSSRSVVC